MSMMPHSGFNFIVSVLFYLLFKYILNMPFRCYVVPLFLLYSFYLKEFDLEERPVGTSKSFCKKGYPMCN